MGPVGRTSPRRARQHGRGARPQPLPDGADSLPGGDAGHPLKRGEVLEIVVVGEPEQAADVENPIRVVRARARPAGFIESGDTSERCLPASSKPGDRILEGRPVRRLGRTRLDPAPMRIGPGRHVVEPSLEHLALDGDQVQHDLLCRPFAWRGVTGTFGGSGRRLDPITPSGNATDELGSSERRPRTHELRPPSVSRYRSRQPSVASTALNVYRWIPWTPAAGSAINGASDSSRPVGR